MKKLIGILSSLLLFISACGTSSLDLDGDSGSQTIDEGLFLTKTTNKLQYELEVNKKNFEQNDIIYVTAKVTNISEDPIPYMGYNGCDDGLHANIPVPEFNKNLLPKGWKSKEPKGCTSALVDYELLPGESLSEEKQLIPMIRMGNEALLVPSGEYTVNLTFQTGHYNNGEKPIHENFQASIYINGTDDLLSEKEAIAIVNQHVDIQDWLSNRTGESVTKIENGQHYIMQEGEWIRSVEELYEKTKKQHSPHQSVSYNHPYWVVQYSDKLQGPPHRIKALVHSETGNISEVKTYKK